MKRDNTRAVLWFVLVVMVCGGGCMTMQRGEPIYPQDLAIVGVNEHTRARLQGTTDPKPGDPEPVSNLSGRLIVYPGFLNASAQQKHQSLQRLSLLDGITDARLMQINWAAETKDRQTPIDFREVLLRHAKGAGGDLLLFSVYRDKTDSAYLTLTLAQWLTLGLAPTVLASADANIEAAIIDVHTGYIYALGEGEGDSMSLTNHWNRYPTRWKTANEAVDEALAEFVDHLEAAWPAMREAYQ